MVTRGISVCCPHSASGEMARPTFGRERGLTLLELLIVLLLLGLMTALVAPRAAGQLEAARQRSLERQLRAVVEDLPMRAFRQGRELAVSSSDLQRMLGEDWPADQRIELKDVLRYGSTGLASGGELTVLRPGQGGSTWYVVPYTGRLSQAPIGSLAAR